MTLEGNTNFYRKYLDGILDKIYKLNQVINIGSFYWYFSEISKFVSPSPSLYSHPNFVSDQ